MTDPVNPWFQFISSNTFVLIAITLSAVFFLTRLNRSILEKLAERYSSQRILIKNFIPLINLGLNLVAVFFILFGVLQVDTDNLLAFGVSAGVAIGFAIQDLLANIFAGLVIVFTRPFNVGDKIQVGNFYGEVLEISLLRVKIVTPDDSQINIPSKIFLQEPVSNANTGELNCQVGTEVLFPGDTDQEKIRKVARDVVYSHPYTLLSKPVSISLQDEYKNISLVKLKIKSYVADHRWEFRYSSELYQGVRKALISELSPGFFKRIPNSSEVLEEI